MLKTRRPANLDVKHDAFTYQFEAFNAVKDLAYAALFHEQGLGKTKIAIDLALYWLRTNVTDCVIVVTKRSLIENWRQELANHTYLKPHVLSQDKRSNYYILNSSAVILLTHYEVIAAEKSRLALFQKTRRVSVILDEAHKIKNPDTGVSQALQQLALGFSRRLILTGTPMANRPYDIWSQIYFLDQGDSLGSNYDDFRLKYDLTNDLSEDSVKRDRYEAALQDVNMKISAFAVRETKQSSGIALPDKVLRNVYVDMEHRQEEIYRKYRDELSTILIKNGLPTVDDAESVLKRLLRLVQVASNPRMLDESYHLDPGKWRALEDLLYEITARSEKAIVWTSFTENADWLAAKLANMGAEVVHGNISIEERNKSIARFKTDPGRKVLVATPGAAKEGLTLTVANHAIFFDRSLSLDDFLQAQDRIHRISQVKKCIVTNLVSRNSIDEWVDSLLQAKQLSAQLGQGDIDLAQYSSEATYSYAEVLKTVLSAEGVVS